MPHIDKTVTSGGIAIPLAISMALPWPAWGTQVVKGKLQQQAISQEAGCTHGLITKPLERILSKRRKWGQQSDPNDHNPHQFSYLVHGIADPGSMERELQTIKQLDWAIKKGTHQDEIKTFDLLAHPEQIKDKPLISASLIDEKHKATYRLGGVILATHPDNILKAAGQDLGTPNVAKPNMNAVELDQLQREADATYLPSPSELLRDTVVGLNNEVVVRGTGKSGRPTKISGVFLIVDENNEPLAPPELALRLRTLARTLSVPVVPIQKATERYADQPLGLEHGRLLVMHRDGIRHFVDLEKGTYEAYKKRAGEFEFVATPETFKTFLAEVKATNQPMLAKLLPKVRSAGRAFARKIKSRTTYVSEPLSYDYSSGVLSVQHRGVRHVFRTKQSVYKAYQRTSEEGFHFANVTTAGSHRTFVGLVRAFLEKKSKAGSELRDIIIKALPNIEAASNGLPVRKENRAKPLASRTALVGSYLD